VIGLLPVLRSKRRRLTWLGMVLAFSALPNQLGFQDLGALLARQPAVGQRWRAYTFASHRATIHAALFSLPRPIGTAIPPLPLYARASVNPNEIAGALGREILGDPYAPLQFPSVNRKGKGDALVMRSRDPMPPRLLSLDELVPSIDTEASFVGIAALGASSDDIAETRDDGPPIYERGAMADRQKREVFFDTGLLDAAANKIRPWAPGQAPKVIDPDIKLAALAPAGKDDVADVPGETIAGKGEVTGVDKRPMSPAERLKLTSASRAKAEKCLAEAVYFEARDEPVRAQIGVAQVVLNRTFSPYYPKTVCDVVYQNVHRHLKCQFTFACDGKRDSIREPEAWVRARRIAKDILDGKLWMPDVAKSTHYHDDWAHPNWVREMRRMDKLGGLIFYRPRNWGDGSEEPKWGDPQTTAKTAANL
jgi:spore germination cell wall hydrolase CwlJ-like protein